MVCINSIIEDQNLLKILNIILNASTGLILSLIANFKIYENIQAFHQLQIKFNKLSHIIDSKITNDLDTINNEYISGYFCSAKISFKQHNFAPSAVQHCYLCCGAVPFSSSVLNVLAVKKFCKI